MVERLKAVQIEHDDALKVIRRFDAPGTLFYVDPPYLLDTRSRRWRGRTYQHELTDENHRHLAELLYDVRGMVIVSGYPSQLYDELYPGWRTASMPVTTDHQGKAVEVLWLSPRLQAPHLKARQKASACRASGTTFFAIIPIGKAPGAAGATARTSRMCCLRTRRTPHTNLGYGT